MLMPHSLISLKTLLSSLCRKKAEVCAVAIFIIAIFTGIIGHTGDLIYGEDAKQRGIKKMFLENTRAEVCWNNCCPHDR